LTNPVKAVSLTSKSLALAYSPVRVKVYVIEPSDAVKRRNGQQTGGRRLALRASLRPQLALWLGLAWRRYVSVAIVKMPPKTSGNAAKKKPVRRRRTSRRRTRKRRGKEGEICYLYLQGSEASPS
jgi:hypothetical protein